MTTANWTIASFLLFFFFFAISFTFFSCCCILHHSSYTIFCFSFVRSLSEACLSGLCCCSLPEAGKVLTYVLLIDHFFSIWLFPSLEKKENREREIALTHNWPAHWCFSLSLTLHQFIQVSLLFFVMYSVCV